MKNIITEIKNILQVINIDKMKQKIKSVIWKRR